MNEKVDYIDIHCHLDLPNFDADRDEVIAQMKQQGVWAITVGVDLKTSQKCVELAEKYAHIYATIGAHPTDSMKGPVLNEVEGFDEKEFEKLIQHPKVVAIGECGLDYFRLTDNVGETKKKQKEVFIQQIKFAHKYHKPLMIHGRPSKGTMDAYEDILSILSTNYQLPTTYSAGDVHFFVGDIPIAKRFLDLGFTLSFDGPITFARDYDEVIKYIPQDSLLAETDAPFAAPVPYRGKRNQPLYVVEIAKKLAEIRGENEETFRNQLILNAVRVFNLKL